MWFFLNEFMCFPFLFPSLLFNGAPFPLSLFSLFHQFLRFPFNVPFRNSFVVPGRHGLVIPRSQLRLMVERKQIKIVRFHNLPTLPYNLTVLVKVKSAYEPSGPIGRSLCTVCSSLSQANLFAIVTESSQSSVPVIDLWQCISRQLFR